MSDSIARMFPGAAQIASDDNARSVRVWTAVMFLLMAAWAVWFFGARVPIFAASDSARFEAVAVHWIEAPVAGQIRTVRTAVGSDVRAGDVLLELDSSTEKLREAEQSLQRTSASERAGLLRRQLAAAEESLVRQRDVARASAAEAQARLDEASEAARLADSEARRARQLFRNGLLSQAALDTLDADATRKRAAVGTMAAAMRRISGEQQVEISTQEAEIEELRAALAGVDAQIGTSNVVSRILEQDAERRLIRAPVGGRVAADLAKRAGSFVQAGERLTSIVPPGGIVVVALFKPDLAVGRIRAGQRARFRLDAFQPVEFGWIEGTVRSIGSEPKDGRVRVEVAIAPRQTRIPIEHGLTGALEVETDSVSPMTLVLRAAGKRL